MQLINIWKCIEVLAPPSSPCHLQCLKIRRTFNCKDFIASKDERNIFKVFLNCTHINNDIAK